MGLQSPTADWARARREIAGKSQETGSNQLELMRDMEGGDE